MKTRFLFALGLATLVFGALAGGKVSPTTIFMRQKLAYSQHIVEGIALEQYDQVITNGNRLWRMSVTNTWEVLKNPLYREKTVKFQTDVVALQDAARARNNADMLAAYAKVTSDCIDCHENFRRVQYISHQRQLQAQGQPERLEPIK
jgi:hypothetical protein